MLGGVKLVIEWASVGYPSECKSNNAMQCKDYVCSCVYVELHVLSLHLIYFLLALLFLTKREQGFLEVSNSWFFLFYFR